MDVNVNYLAVFLAAVASMVVGSVWYLPSVFGKQWMKLTGVKMDKSQPTSKMVMMYGGTFIASLLTAYILAHVTFLSHTFFKDSFMQDALTTAFWLWLGFTAARLYVHDTFEGRKGQLTLLNSGFELVTVLIMALVIGWFGV